jgi:hypothetical protein
MAEQPSVAELLQLIQTLQGQVQALQATNANANAAAVAPQGTAPVVFADTPSTLSVEDIIDYKTKQGSQIFENGCKALDDKALTDGFNMSMSQSVVFVEALQRKCSVMGWNQGTKGITSFINKDGKTIDLIKQYGQIDEATLKTQCETFCKPGQANAQTRAKQNNTMMAICLMKTLTAGAQAKLLACRSEFTFDDVEYAPMMYKIIMRLTTMDSVATTQSLRENLNNLATFAATVQGDVDKIHEEFDKNYSQIIARGATVDDPIQILFDAYNAVPCYNFKKYIESQENDYLDGKLAGITHDALRKMAKSKFDWLVNKKKWGARSPDDDKIVAMAAEIHKLKGQLKLDPKLSQIAGGGNDDKDGGKKRAKKNKKDTSNKRKQKEDEAWKKVPPKDGDPKTKKHGELTFNWCIHHMAWTVHKPSECKLGKKMAEEQKSSAKAHSAIVAASAASTVNPHFAAMLATLGSEDDE